MTPEEVYVDAVVVGGPEPAQPSPAAPRRRGWPWRTGLVLVLLAGIAYAAVRHWTWEERSAALAEIRARGEPASLEDLLAPEPFAGTAVPLLLEAQMRLGEHSMADMGQEFVAELARRVPAHEALPVTPLPDEVRRLVGAPLEPDPAIDRILEECRAVRDLVVRAAALPPGRLTLAIDRASPADTPLPTNEGMRPLGWLQELAVIQAAGRRRPRDAHRELVVLFRLPALLEREPFNSSHLVRAEMIDRACTMAERLLAVAPPDESEFRRLDELAASHAGRLNGRIGMIGDRAVSLSMTDNPALFDASMPGRDRPLTLALYGSFPCDPWRWWATADAADFCRFWLKTSDMPSADAEARMSAWRGHYADRLRRLPAVDFYLNRWTKWIVEASRVSARLAAMRLALRAHRFRLRTGSPPKTLAEAVGSELDLGPSPLFDNQPPPYYAGDWGLFVGWYGRKKADRGFGVWVPDRKPAP